MTLEEFRLTFGDIVRSTCKRPEMYMMNGTFAEALAFLDGYAYGARLGNPGSSSSYFNPFLEWLCNRFGWEEEGDFWRRFRDSYGDDQIALGEFARLFSEYEAVINSTQREEE